MIRTIIGDCRTILPTLPAESVHCVVTSPPYWGLRDYGVAGQIGLEPTYEAFIAEMVAVFREVRRVLRKDGTLWLNLGDSYVSGGGTGHQGKHGERYNRTHTQRALLKAVPVSSGLKPKDLCGIPWRVAFALQSDGWWLRQDIIWSKPNPMPESVTDRCTKAHEYVFLLSKADRYYYDAEAIREPQSEWTHERFGKDPRPSTKRKLAEAGSGTKNNSSFDAAMVTMIQPDSKRNKRSVWEVSTAPFAGAHFAIFPPALIEPCIKAGCPKDGTVLDPFGGVGTTGLVADRLQRNAILIELNPNYAKMAKRRMFDDAPLFVEAAE
jgi:DNA modification methylase